MDSEKLNRSRKVNASKKTPFGDGLSICRDLIKQSGMFNELCDALEPYKETISKIRCLAIGSFYEDYPARYQLALLLELVDYVQKGKQTDLLVSLYDPVFTQEDVKYINSLGPRWTIDEIAPEWEPDSLTSTLFFLPHASLGLTEKILRTEKPHLWLANHVVAHTDRYTKLQLHEKYPVMSKLLHVLESPNVSSETKDKVVKNFITGDDQFTTFVSKRKRRKNKVKYTEPIIDYSLIESHINSCKILTSFQDGDLLKNQLWLNSFSDLALHLIE